MENVVEKSEKKLSVFWKMFITIFSVLIIAIVVSLVILWNFLSDYEKTRPTKIMDNIVYEINSKNYDSLVDNLNLVKSGFAKGDDVKTEIIKAVGDEKATYVKAFSSDRVAKPTFKIMVGKKALVTVTLKASGEKSRFNQQKYDIEHISNLYSKNKPIKLSVPSGYKVKVNDTELGEEWVAGEEAPIFDSNFAISEDAKSIRMKIYNIDGFLADSALSVLKPDGTAAELSKNKSGKLTANLETVEISAPKEYKVFVNEVEISGKSWVTEENILPEILERIPEKYFAKLPTTTNYKVTGILGTPKIKITDAAGKTVNYSENKETGKYFTQVATSSDEELEAFALEFAKLYARATTADYPKSSFIAKILPDAPVKAELQKAMRPEFYTTHSKYGFENEKVFNLQIYDENAFSCDVTLTQWISGISASPASRVDKFTATNRFCFIKQNGKWMMGEWMLVSE